MGMMSKRKGAIGELEFSRLCKEFGFKTKRTAQHCGKTGEAGDVEGIPGLHLEVKRTETLSLYKALAQATRDSLANGEGKIPVVAHRRNREDWVIIINARDFLEMYKKLLQSEVVKNG